MKIKTILLTALMMVSSIAFADNPTETFNPLAGKWIYQANNEGSFDNIFNFSTNESLNLSTIINDHWGTISNFSASFDGHSLTNNAGTQFALAGVHEFRVQGVSGQYGSGYDASITVSAVPEPSELLMMLAGIGLILSVTRKKSK